MRDLVLILAGDTCVHQEDMPVSSDICCEKIQKGCGKVEDEPPKYIDGQCLNDDCSMCELAYHPATNYFNDADVLLRRIIDYSNTMNEQVNDKAECCAAGIQLEDSDLIKACIVDGIPYVEYELTDENECVDRRVTPKMYQDADGNAIPGYADFTEVTSVAILPPDDCCMKACEDEPFNFLLPACPTRQTAAGALAY